MPSLEELNVVKFYASRRPYKTATSTYVTLDDVAAVVRNGEDFAAVDATSSEDITRSILMVITPTTTEH